MNFWNFKIFFFWGIFCTKTLRKLVRNKYKNATKKGENFEVLEIHSEVLLCKTKLNVPLLWSYSFDFPPIGCTFCSQSFQLKDKRALLKSAVISWGLSEGWEGVSFHFDTHEIATSIKFIASGSFWVFIIFRYNQKLLK